jgi:hypothetical protein
LLLWEIHRCPNSSPYTAASAVVQKEPAGPLGFPLELRRPGLELFPHHRKCRRFCAESDRNPTALARALHHLRSPDASPRFVRPGERHVSVNPAERARCVRALPACQNA